MSSDTHLYFYLYVRTFLGIKHSQLLTLTIPVNPLTLTLTLT